MRKQILFVVFLCLGIWGLLAAEGSPATLNVLKGINKTTENGNIVIQLEGTTPILNATFYDYPPDKFVVDIPDLDISQVPSKLEISSDVVSAVKLESISNAKDKPLIQLEIEKSALAKCLVSTEGNNLFIKVIRDGEAGGGGNPQPAAPAAATAQNKGAAPKPAAALVEPAENAKVLKGIQIVDDGKSVIIEADGQVQYKYFALKNPERLVIDLKGIDKSLVAMRTEGKGDIQQVRANLFKANPPVMRVVLDLAQEGSWKVAPVGNGVVATTEDNLASFQKPSVQEAPEELKLENPKAEKGDAVPEPAPVAEAPVQPAQDEKIETAAADGINKKDPGAKISVNESAALENVSVELKPIHSSASKEFKGYEDLFVAQDTSVKAPEAQAASAPVVPLSFKEKTIAGDETQYSGLPLSLSLKDADVKDVLRLFHDISKLNIVVHPAVQGKVTIDLENVPWDQAMDIVLKNLGLDYIYEKNVIWVAPSSEISRKFADKQKLEEEKLNAEPTVTITKRLSYAKVDGMKPILTKFLSSKGEVITDKRTNTLILREVPTKKDALVKLVDTLDAATSQVLIEARIVESTVSWRQQFGISWGGGSDSVNNFPNNQTGFPNWGWGDFAVNVPPPAGNGFIDLLFGNIAGTFNLDVKLSALENTGRGRVISAPKVMTADNEKASIESGRQIPVPIATADKVSVIYINATLKLDVTPHITADGNVNMDVNITNDAVDFQNQSAGSPPPIFKKEAKTVLRVKDGQTAVIGGIFVTTEGISQQGIPFFSKIPVLGWLFKNRIKNRDNSELLIFLTPKIIR